MIVRAVNTATKVEIGILGVVLIKNQMVNHAHRIFNAHLVIVIMMVLVYLMTVGVLHLILPTLTDRKTLIANIRLIME